MYTFKIKDGRFRCPALFFQQVSYLRADQSSAIVEKSTILRLFYPPTLIIIDFDKHFFLFQVCLFFQRR